MNFDSISWVGAEGECEGHVLLVRLREFPTEFPKSKYPQHINIFWKMSETDENGLPTDEEFSRLATFEDRIVNAVEHDEHSILVGALTCNGEKEFVFHTSDVPRFLQRLTNMPQEEERYPITIQKYDDPDWNYFKSLIPISDANAK